MLDSTKARTVYSHKHSCYILATLTFLFIHDSVYSTFIYNIVIILSIDDVDIQTD